MLSSLVLVLLLLGPCHLMVVGTHGCLVIVLGCLLWLWVVVTVARFCVMGAHHCCECSHSWGVVGHCGCACLWVVGGHCGQLCHLLCTHHVCRHLSLFMFMSSCWSLLKVITVGSHCCLLLLCTGGGMEVQDESLMALPFFCYFLHVSNFIAFLFYFLFIESLLFICPGTSRVFCIILSTCVQVH